MSNDSLIEKLSKLATHLHSLDSGSGEGQFRWSMTKAEELARTALLEAAKPEGQADELPLNYLTIVSRVNFLNQCLQKSGELTEKQGVEALAHCFDLMRHIEAVTPNHKPAQADDIQLIDDVISKYAALCADYMVKPESVSIHQFYVIGCHMAALLGDTIQQPAQAVELPHSRTIEAVAKAIYEVSPLWDKETDLDGRPIGEGYWVTWETLFDYDGGYYNTLCKKAEAAIAAMSKRESDEQKGGSE